MCNVILATKKEVEISEKDILPGMLSSPHIYYYIFKHFIIDNFDEKCLNSAVYQMRLGDRAIRWENGNEILFNLGKEKDTIKKIDDTLILEPNSLTFVTTIEKFNLPKDIIARFNLKGKWIHNGLLLGTGPIVDPEFKSQLCIPIHNFSCKQVKINYGQTLINVEFTKTLSPDDICIKKTSGGDKKFLYIKNKSESSTFDDFRAKTTNVESSVYNSFKESNKEIEDSKTNRSIWNKRFTIGGLVILASLIVSIAVFFYSGYQLVQSTNVLIDASHTHLLSIQKIVEQSKNDIGSLREDRDRIQNDLDLLLKQRIDKKNR